MIKSTVVLVLCAGLLVACVSQQGGQNKNQIVVEEGTYRAVISKSNMDETTKAYSMTSEIDFTFEKDHKFIYKVRAMGKKADDVGKWKIDGDSLYLFDLERGPNSVFHIEKISAGQFEIDGPNKFTLTKSEPVEPVKN